MSETNGKKYDIDELVNALLMERQPNLTMNDLDNEIVEEDFETGYILDFDEDMSEDDDDLDDELPLILDLDEFKDMTAIGLENEKLIDDEQFRARTVDKAEKKPAVDKETNKMNAEPSKPMEEPKVVEVVPKVASEETKAVPSPPLFEAKAEPPIETTATVAAVAAVAVEAVAETTSKKRKKLFGRKMEDTATIERSWSDWGLKPIGHYRVNEENAPTSQAEVEVPVATSQKSSMPPAKQSVSTPVAEEKGLTKSAQVDEFPAVAAVAETITMQVVLPSGVALPRGEAHTRIMPTITEEEPPAKAADPLPKAEPNVEEQLPDQLSLEEMVRVEDIEPAEGVTAVEGDMDPEERWQLAREEKVREFTLDGTEEEENEPDEESAEVQEKEMEDYTDYQDTETVDSELRYRCRASLLSLLFSGLIQVVLLFLTLLTVAMGEPPMRETAYVMTHFCGLGLMMVLNYSTIIRGLSGLFTLRANSDTAPALAAVVGLTDVIMHFVNTGANPPCWTPLVGLFLTLSAAGHYAHELCVKRNFAFVSYPGDKYAAAVVEEEDALQEIGRRAVSDGDATVAYFRRTGFLTNYLANAYDDDAGDDWSRWMTPAAFGLSVLLSLLALMSDHVTGLMEWMSVFTAMVCLSLPVATLAVQLPLVSCCRRMLSQGGFLAGWKAVRHFGQPDALAVDIADLYPDESMRLHGIKTFTGTHVDEAILAAASLAIRSGGPLAMIFRRIIENKEELLYEVDTLVYEQGMGLSGWVDGRRVFVGNGRLLQNHGVDVPSADFEARYAKDGRKLVYVSIAGQLSAMFVVSYLPDPEIQASLQELCRSRVTLLVRSCDPNITTSDLCESFELDEYYVDVLPASAGRMYVQLTEQSVESMPAVMASNGHILGTARVLSACRNLQIKVRIALVVQTIIALLSLIFCLVLTMKNGLSMFQPLALVTASVFFSWFIPLFRRA